MGRICISLGKWIALAALHESSINGGYIEAVPAVADGITRDAQLAYLARAIGVALLLLNHLKNDETSRPDAIDSTGGDAYIQAEDIVVENFNVEIDVDELADGGVPRQIEHVGNGIKIKVKPITEGNLTGVQFSSSLQQKSLFEKGTIHSDSTFQRIGLLLFRLFCRGESPPFQLKSNGGNGRSEDSISHAPSHKRLNKTKSNQNHETFVKHNIPASISRLVSDLMQNGESVENPFESLDDIISELNQFSEKPDVFLYSKDTHPEQLDFGKEVYGRAEQVHSLLHVAANVSIEMDSLQNKLVLISGPSGSGKSFLFRSIQEPMSDSGFMNISAKFDQLPQQQPLSTIASAFDDFFVTVAASRQNGEVDDNVADMVASIERDLSTSGIAILGNLLPSIRSLFPHILRRVVSDTDLSTLGEEQSQLPESTERGNIIQDNEEDNTASNAESSRNRLHHLFRRLVNAISSPEHPVLLFLDDLQWADRSSLDLFASLLLDFDHLDQHDGNNNISQHFLVVGTYRDNEVDQSHKLNPWLAQMDESNSVLVNKISLGGMPTKCTNDMISNVLKLPLRLTRSLTDVIMTKTLGNPFHVKAFVNSLVEKHVLHYSLLEKHWIWDIAEVSAVSIDEDVAELLRRKVLQLPSNVQAALKFVSCLGSCINENILQPLSSSENWEGLVDGLESAVNENILEKRGQGYRFCHDMLQQASYELLDEEECCELHFTIGMQLISSMSLSEDDTFSPAAFVAIGQINRAKAHEATEIFQIQFATLNLMAGRKSIEVSDFVSALSYLEFGIAFLPEEGWQSNYELSLDLYESASLSCFVLVSIDKMKAFLEGIFEHARCHEDKLRGSYWLIRSIAGIGSSDESIDRVLNILRSLGEDFPTLSEITPDTIRRELESTKIILNDLTKEDILAAQRMTDRSKIWTVKYLALFILYLYHKQPKYLPLVASRVIKISACCGYISDSAFGFIGLGHSLIILCQDIDTGCRLGKMALLLLDGLNTNESRPRVKYWYCSLFCFWKEPIQAIVPMLIENEKESLAAGDVEYAGLGVFSRCRLSFLMGYDLALAERECSYASAMMARLQQLNIHVALTVLCLTIVKLKGSKHDPFDEIDIPIKNEDDLFRYAIANGKVSIVSLIHINRMMCAFWFKRFEEAAEIAKKYDSSRLFGYYDVSHVFFEGVSALYCARHRSNEPQWMQTAEKALALYQTYAQHSCWNFEHRLLLLEAEWHFAKSEIEKAAEKYEAAIDSAQKHRFVNEEGMANDLYSTFCTANGRVDKAKKHISQARACYQKWGAHALVDLLDSTSKY